MKIAVLGGCGIQGRTAIHDLTRNPEVEEIICADQNPDGLDQIAGFADLSRVSRVKLDVTDKSALVSLLGRVDSAVDMLPRHFLTEVAEAAIETGVGVVNTNYAYPILELDGAAKAAGVSIMPECGLDPGIDLVIYGRARDEFDTLEVINSYCGGFPEAKACDNPLNYKISWIWEGVLSSTKRPGRIIKDGKVVDISAADQHNERWVHELDFPGLGRLEALPNGDAVFFTDQLGVTADIRETGRYSLRWPGWSAFWRPLKELGFLDDEPVAGLPGGVSPHQFMDKHLAPRLQYRADEKDLVVMVNVFEGRKGGRKVRKTSRLLIERDLGTGLMAMSMGVGYPASIVAQMLARGEIAEPGVLSPTRHIPYQPFMAALAERGVRIDEVEEELD